MNQREIERDYVNMVNKHIKGKDWKPKVNCYKCISCGHVTKTIEVDKGVTPFIIFCEKCAKEARSTMYADLVPGLNPTVTWFRPDLKQTLRYFRKNKQMFNHIMSGGLDYRYENTIVPEVSGVEMISIERVEQLTKHKRTVLDDTVNNPDEALLSAVLAIISESIDDFPSNWNNEICARILNKPRDEQLAVAGALIAAQIDVIRYLEKHKNEGDTEDNKEEGVEETTK